MSRDLFLEIETVVAVAARMTDFHYPKITHTRPSFIMMSKKAFVPLSDAQINRIALSNNVSNNTSNPTSTRPRQNSFITEEVRARNMLDVVVLHMLESSAPSPKHSFTWGNHYIAAREVPNATSPSTLNNPVEPLPNIVSHVRLCDSPVGSERHMLGARRRPRNVNVEELPPNNVFETTEAAKDLLDALDEFLIACHDDVEKRKTALMASCAVRNDFVNARQARRNIGTNYFE